MSTRMVLVAALLSGACWTGSVEPAQTPVVRPERRPEPMPLRVKLERTACFGRCPTYALVIQGDGRVHWVGHANVAAIGQRQGKVTRRELEELSKRISRARFFERNEYGELPAKPECTTIGGTTSCTFGASFSICSDTSHTILTVKQGIRTHTIDNDHCNPRPELEALEDYIVRITNSDAWIGP